MDKVIKDLADKIFDLIDVEADKDVCDLMEKGRVAFMKLDFDLCYHYNEFKSVMEKYYLNIAKKCAELMFEYGIKIGINFKDIVKKL